MSDGSHSDTSQILRVEYLSLTQALGWFCPGRKVSTDSQLRHYFLGTYALYQKMWQIILTNQLDHLLRSSRVKRETTGDRELHAITLSSTQ